MGGVLFQGVCTGERRDPAHTVQSTPSSDGMVCFSKDAKESSSRQRGSKKCLPWGGDELRSE